MKKWLRTGQLSRNLIIVVAVIAVIAIGFWVVKWRGKAAEKSDLAGQLFQRSSYTLWCPNCEKAFKMSAEEARELSKDKQDGKMKCPECGEYVCQWGEPARGGAVAP